MTEMALYKELKKLKEELDYWESYEPVNGMGKWARSVRVDRIKSKIQKIEKELQRRKEQKDDSK
jgi:hypothetical protein